MQTVASSNSQQSTKILLKIIFLIDFNNKCKPLEMPRLALKILKSMVLLDLVASRNHPIVIIPGLVYKMNETSE
ncbi:MAG: hypothetical protein ACTSXP_19205 [Promethearchaeota archaeon]